MAIQAPSLDKRDLRRLELFREIVEQGGISNATHSTGLSQPVLSNQLITLEKSLGVSLCKRGRSGFELTDEGRSVYNYANEISAMLTEYAFKLKGVQSTLSGHVRVGCLDNTATLTHNPLLGAIEQFYQLSDDVEVTLDVGDFTQLNEKLSSGQLDMMICVLGEHQLAAFEFATPLFVEQSHLYARRDLAEAITVNDYALSGCRINMGGYAAESMKRLLEIEQHPGAKLYSGWHVESGLMLTLAGSHLSFLPTHLIEQNHACRHLIALQPDKWKLESQFYLITKAKPDSLSSAVQAFTELLCNPQRNA
ncbi:LysR family transcriptional regulator [Photobacterium rosenbergii]|uniref:LysR family transcriptional regulator n=1 Tax=Photobacterium rosenbergii TaxID=294936 RepID=A0A2T3NAQ8_9GAMM|nr:LysR family transcriptional regulator [Photobacterium rosenbergii]PSW10815.1 LysR family transcriptional regulator [Photobacterium rosenbergii]